MIQAHVLHPSDEKENSATIILCASIFRGEPEWKLLKLSVRRLVLIIAIVCVSSMGQVAGLVSAPDPHPHYRHESHFEVLFLEFATFMSDYNATLIIRNGGVANVTLASYYVKDSSGDTYFRRSWSSGNNPQTTAITPTGLGVAVILIGTLITVPATQCGNGCSLTGKAFTFQPGQSYNVTVVTERHNMFSFTITR